ncbi:inner centromere protein A-like [Xyrichtys novacula]|uniref:Inner centromere protein A-like n=1 Tax=Xyrichtys novacula TaxID=13765 RepID=A0AAV1GST2_XYRNO|nr:inner centromere protein A-like [Xyrichtys novacula]
MDRRFPFYYLSAIQLQQPQLQFSDSYIIQRLRDTLNSTINDVKLLKEQNKALKNQQKETGPDVYAITLDLLARKEEEVKHLKEELQLKDGLLESAVKKEQRKTKTCEDALAQKEVEIKSLRNNLRRELDLKEELGGEIKERDENQLATEKLKVTRLQEKLESMIELLSRAVKQRPKRTTAYLDTMDLPNRKEMELKKTEYWRSKCTELQKSPNDQTSQLQVLQSSDI